MGSISVPTALIGSSVLGGVSSLASGAMGAGAASSASAEQQQAAAEAQQMIMQMYGETSQNLSPFISAGQSAAGALQNLTGTNAGGNPLTAPLTAQFQPTQAQLAQTPGYQFSLNQGLQATQNGYAAQGLAQSGSALKGAANYAEGLASTTYQNQFQNYLAGNQQTYNMLAGQSQLGAGAAGQLGSIGAQEVTGGSNALMSGAAAGAAGTVGSTNALTGALSGISGAASNYALLTGLNNGGMFGSASKAGQPGYLTSGPSIG